MILSIVKNIVKSLKPKQRSDLDEKYLAKATDMTDLERRIRHLENPNLKNWI